MAQAQLLSQLKFRVASLESALSDKQRQMQDLRDIEMQADSKIKALNKIHNDKVKSLLNSIQILKKQKASIEGLSKQHKRSKLIQQLNKQILDQDIVIDVLRKFVYDDKGKDKGRQICDQIIVKALVKGPQRIRAQTREELRMQIQKLKAAHLKINGKNKDDKAANGVAKSKEDGQASQISSVSSRSFVNQNQQVYHKLKDLQNQNQGLKLQISTKGKIIQKLKSQVKQKDRFKGEVQLLTNQLQVSSRKAYAFQQLLRQTKQKMNAKIADLYQRELKVEELELNTQQNGEMLKQAHQSNNLLLEQAKQEKEQLQVQLQLMRKQNQTLMLENITMKKRQDQQKTKIVQIRQINSKNKDQLGQKLKQYQIQINKIMNQNTSLTQLTRQLQNKLFKEKADWVQQKAKLIEQLQNAQMSNNTNPVQSNRSGLEQLTKLRKQNHDLKQLLQSGAGGRSDDKILLQRLQNYRIRLQFYEIKQGKNQGKQRQLYDELFQKYNSLLNQFQIYKKLHPPVQAKPKKINIVQVTRKDEQNLNNINSGISNLGLSDVGSSVLDKYDSSYDYQLRVDDFDRKKFKGLPKMTEQDKQLLKLINSDLWEFVKDDRVDAKIGQAIQVAQNKQSQDQYQLTQRIKKIKNISHPQGKKIQIYDSQLMEMQGMSDNVSGTSALQKDIDKYDSDIDIQVKKTVQGSPSVNFRQLGALSDDYNSSLNVSRAQSGDSNFIKQQPKQPKQQPKQQKPQYQQDQRQLAQKIRKIKNISHPQGKKIVIYDSQIKQMQNLSDRVSVTSALQKEIDRYDSDIDIQVKRTIQGSPSVNYRQLGEVSDGYNSSINVSSVKSGDSNFVKRKKAEKATVIKLKKEEGSASSVVASQVGSDMNSSVSSINVKESMLDQMDSDISVDFRKKKAK